MKLGLQTAGAFLLTVTLATAASTTFVSIWSNPKAGPFDATAVKMATFVLSSDDTMRWGPEETLAAELRRRGMDAVAGYTVLPGELAKDKEKAKGSPVKMKNSMARPLFEARRRFLVGQKDRLG